MIIWEIIFYNLTYWNLKMVCKLILMKSVLNNFNYYSVEHIIMSNSQLSIV